MNARPPAAITEPPLRSTLIGAACLSLQPLVLNVLSVPVLAYIIYRLGPEPYAHWTVAVSLLAVASVLTNFGLRGAFVRAVAADPSRAAAALAEQLGLRLLLTVLAGTLVVLACLALGYPRVVIACAAVGSVAMVLTTVATTLGDLLLVFERIKPLAAINLIAGLTLTGVSLLLAWRGGGPVAIAAAYLTGPALAAVLLVTLVRKHICTVSVRWDLPRFAHLLAQSRFLAAQQLVGAGSAQAEALVLPRLIPMSHFGSFSAAAMIPSRLGAIPDGLATAAYPGLVRACAHGPHRAASLVARYLLLAAAAAAAIALAASFAINPIGRMLFPADPGLFTLVGRITIWSLPLVAVDMVLSYALNAAGQDARQARASLWAAVLSLAVCVALLVPFGVIGACGSIILRPAVRIAFLAPLARQTFRAASASDAPTVLHSFPASPLPLRKAV